MRTSKSKGAEMEAPTLRATSIDFEQDYMRVHLSNGRELCVPLDVTPRLQNATPEQRRNWRFIGRGEGIHWEEIDEDLSVSGLVRDFGAKAHAVTSSEAIKSSKA